MSGKNSNAGNELGREHGALFSHKSRPVDLEWHGRAAAVPKEASKTSTTVDYVEDGADPGPPPADIDEILEVGIEPPAPGVQ